MRIKNFLRRHLRKMGWDIRRFSPQNSEWSRLVQQLQVHDVDVVFDIGANIGQFAQNLRNSGFEGRIVSFEAATAAYGELLSRAIGIQLELSLIPLYQGEHLFR